MLSKIFSIVNSKSFSLPRFHHNKQPKDLHASRLPCDDCLGYRLYEEESEGVQPPLVVKAEGN